MTLPNDLNVFAPGLKLLKTMEFESAMFRSLSWSPDGSSLAGPAESTTGFYKIGIETFSIGWHPIGTPVRDIAWSPESDSIACLLMDGTLYLYSSPDKKALWRAENKSTSSNVTWSPDGQILIVTSPPGVSSVGETAVWDARTGQTMTRLHAKSYARPVFFADSRRLVCAAQSSTTPLTTWDVTTGLRVQEFNNVYLQNGDYLGMYTPVELLALSFDERLIASGGYMVAIWDVQSEKPIKNLFHPKGKLESLAFSPAGEYLVGTSQDNILRIWAARKDWQQVVQLPDFGGGWKGGAAFHPTKPILATGAQGGHAIHFWEYNSSAWR